MVGTRRDTAHASRGKESSLLCFTSKFVFVIIPIIIIIVIIIVLTTITSVTVITNIASISINNTSAHAFYYSH